MQFLWFKTPSKKSKELTLSLILLGYTRIPTRYDYSFYVLFNSTNIYNYLLRIHKYKAKYYIYDYTTGTKTFKNIN